jgi:hypothetical protein
MALTPDLARRVSSYIDRTLRGAKPGELPAKFELVVNLKTAKAIGVTTPEIFLAPADHPGIKPSKPMGLQPHYHGLAP